MKIKFFSVLLIVLGLAGCATQQPLTDEEIVTKRAQARLDALLAKDMEKSYTYATPTYRRSVPFNRHKPKILGSAMWTKGEILNVSCEVDYCDVTSKIHYNSPQIRTEIPTELVDRWIKVDGQWWIYHR